ncbi:MAG TPA: bacillithiol biosynthesis cysteine-adding enzyme BshC [Flavobacterium sp.]|jgi:bacillithiol biosynthesis cysteine-adding enzyme BshC
MPNDYICYQDSGYFSTIITDYLNEKPELQQFYNRFPHLHNFKNQIEEKQTNYNTANNNNRKLLVAELEKQYALTICSKETKKNIESLVLPTTFTITTGHQLNLFTGPIYFLYKIVSTINLTNELKTHYPEYNFVPVYWMATEDHDFEEINYFNFKGKKFRWNKKSSGAVGRLSTAGLEEVFNVFSAELGIGNNATTIKKIFHDAYLQHDNLTDATRFLANVLFGKYGLVIVDADSANLKKQFVPYVKEELLHQVSFKAVSETITALKQYKVKVNPREMNLFYLDDNLRERILLENGRYLVNNTTIEFSEDEILLELENHPEKFSPNVVMRPLYQEILLPNLCYIGGGGELAYWLELKSYFDTAKVTFPMLLLRNSALLVTQKKYQLVDKLHLKWNDLFMKQQDLINLKVKELSEFSIDFSAQKIFLQKQFAALYVIAEQTDPSFTGAVKAQEAKQLKGLNHLEKRLLKAQKRKHAEAIERIKNLQDQLFPGQGLQERQFNFSEFYLEYGDAMLEQLFQNLKPLEHEFKIIVL